jgi:adenylate cyclase
MGRKGALWDAQLALRRHFTDALAAYRARQWDEARDSFAQALAAAPDDGPARAFLSRIDRLLEAPPGKEWDGSWRLDEK